MFGYVVINQAELKLKDFETYHAYYCGLCKCLSDKYGKTGQMTLSYDMTFLVILLTGLYEPENQSMTVNCITHPFQKHPALINKFTDYAADMSLLLSYYKSLDDWEDEGKRRQLVNANVLKKRVSRIKKQYPKKAKVIRKDLKAMHALEKKNEKNIDRMAGLFGDIMAEIFVYRKDEWEPSMRRIGFFLGKFVYLMDAYEDVEDDVKKSLYNPFSDGFTTLSPEDFADRCKSILTMMLAECSREFEKLPILTHADILRNILYSGVWSRYNEITKKRNPDDKTTDQTGGQTDGQTSTPTDTGDQKS